MPNGPTSLIRRATARDAAAIADLLLPVIRDTTISFRPDPPDPSEVAAQIKDPDRLTLVAQRDADAPDLIGTASYGAFRSGAGYRFIKEHSIVLSPGVRGHGLGRHLMTALESEARANGITSLFAGVSGENPAAVAFHEAIGFNTVAHLPRMGHKFDRWIDLILMRKHL